MLNKCFSFSSLSTLSLEADSVFSAFCQSHYCDQTLWSASFQYSHDYAIAPHNQLLANHQILHPVLQPLPAQAHPSALWWQLDYHHFNLCCAAWWRALSTIHQSPSSSTPRMMMSASYVLQCIVATEWHISIGVLPCRNVHPQRSFLAFKREYLH